MIDTETSGIQSHTVVGLFESFPAAQAVASELEQQGFSRDDISIVANDAKGEYASGLGSGHAGETASGAGTGAAIGGAAGLALGLAALAIPGVGPIIAAGPLATALTGAGIGAVAGGLIGALTNMGVPEEDAQYYSEGVSGGGALVMVKAAGDRAHRAAEILERSGADNVEEDGEASSSSKSGVRMYGHEASDPESSFRGRGVEDPVEDNQYAGGMSHDESSPAYRYGSSLANDVRYNGKEWSAIEPHVRRDWEARGEGAWDSVKDSVRSAWDKVTGRR